MQTKTRLCTALCPHCERIISTRVIAWHVVHCPARPRLAARLAVELDDGWGYIIPQNEYCPSESAPGLPGAKPLLEHYGSWEGVASALGLRVRTKAELRELARRHQALYEWMGMHDTGRALTSVAGCRRTHGVYTFDGLHVCAMRPLPSGGVAYMLR